MSAPAPASSSSPASGPADAPSASSSASSSAAPSGSTLAGGKSCSACQRTLHASAFSGTQAKNPAKTRKCMECVVNNKPSAGQAEEQPAAAASATSSSSSSTAPTGGNAKKKAATNPGAIARSRRAERDRESAEKDIQASLMRKVHGGGIKDMKEAQEMLKQLMLETEKSVTSSSASSSSSSSAGGQLINKPTKGKGTGNPQSIFTAARRSTDQSGKQHLLDEDEEWFLPAAEGALEEIFRRFDSTHKGKATAQEGAEEERTPRDSLCWTLSDTQSFARTTNGKEFSTEELMEIKENLTHDSEGRLTLQGFLDFYHLQTTSHPDETWKDLKKLGYDHQLQLKKKA